MPDVSEDMLREVVFAEDAAPDAILLTFALEGEGGATLDDLGAQPLGRALGDVELGRGGADQLARGLGVARVVRL